MKIISTILPEVLIIEPAVFNDTRGQFFESFHKLKYKDAGIPVEFIQDNVSVSMKNVLRGLHFQYPYGQDKLVSVLQGEVLDIILDIRIGSPTFGQWVSIILNNDNKRQVFVPQGFAHGFIANCDNTIFSYKCSDYYNSQTEHSILWNDPMLDIAWTSKEPLLSSKDSCAQKLNEYQLDQLPKYKNII